MSAPAVSQSAATPPVPEFGTVSDLIHAHALRDPRHPALRMGERVLDFAALDALMDRVAASLQRDSFAPRDALAVCAYASLEYAVLFLGALRAGVVVAPLAPSCTGEELAGMVEDADARLFFLDAGAAQTVAPVAARIAPARIALDGSDAGRPFAEWLAPEGAKPSPVEVQPDWAFNIIYSSGTTGRPKGIVQSHFMRWSQIQRATLAGYGTDTVTMVATPLYSNTTLVCFFPTLGHGGCAVLMAKFDAGEWLALAEKHRATHAMLVPVQYQRIMARPDFDGYDLSSFRYKFSTSAPFRAALKADVLQRWPGGLVEYYGMTEGGGTCILEAHLYPHKLHTVGKPGPANDIRMIDEDGREVPYGETGEVVGRSPNMMNGYHKQPGKTREAEWYSPEGERFIRTGDLARFDEDGFVVLMDRKKDMIITGGFNVYPSDLEAVMLGHPEVHEVAVVAMPSEAWGETPVAFVVRKDGATVEAEALRAWTNAKVNKIQRLAAVQLVDQLPRSAIGKVLKRELRDSFRGQVA